MPNSLISELNLITLKVLRENGYPRTEAEFDAQVEVCVEYFRDVLDERIAKEINGGGGIALPFQMKAE